MRTVLKVTFYQTLMGQYYIGRKLETFGGIMRCVASFFQKLAGREKRGRLSLSSLLSTCRCLPAPSTSLFITVPVDAVIMLRTRGRNAASSSPSALPTTVSTAAAARRKHHHNNNNKGTMFRSGGGGNAGSGTGGGPSDKAVIVMVAVALLLFVVAYLLPTPAPIAQWEKAAEDEISELWHEFHDAHGVKPPMPAHEHDPEWHAPGGGGAAREAAADGDATTTAEAAAPSSKSRVTGASWVEGEQLLKQELVKLAARQAQGLDVGVPALTRWLGPDVPAWPADPSPAGREAWQKLVDAKYAEMREEENEWQRRMTAYLQTSTRG